MKTDYYGGPQLSRGYQKTEDLRCRFNLKNAVISMYPKCPVNVSLVLALASSNCKLWLIELTLCLL